MSKNDLDICEATDSYLSVAFYRIQLSFRVAKSGEMATSRKWHDFGKHRENAIYKKCMFFFNC